MKYISCSEYKAAEYPDILNKINSVLGHEEHPGGKQHWPPYRGIDARNPFLNVVLHYVETGKVKNPKDIKLFIETGTCTGTTTMHFASIFEEVHTVEKYEAKVTNLGEPLPENHYKNIKTNFENITLWWGDSYKALETIFNESDNKTKRAVILLDAHNGITEVPLLQELEVIEKNSLIKDHFILIDDGADCGSGNFPSYDEIKQALRRINPEYQIEYTGQGRNVIAAY